MAIDWVEYRQSGFFCIPGDFYLDPNTAVDRAVVSHAHADHYPRGITEVHATAPTLAIAQTRYREKAGKRLHPHELQVPFRIGEVEVILYPAGHMLGSAQICLRYRGQTVLYSGDFALTPNSTCASLVFPDFPIDLLICESTFGEKGKHSDPETAIRRTLQEAGFKPILIAVYPVGKAQHVTHLLTKVAPEIPVMLHFEVYRYHQVYENHGFTPGKYQFYRRLDRRARLLPHVFLVTPRVMSSFSRDYDYHKVMATGWDAKSRMPYLNGSLDISDHVDGEELRTYIRTLQPKKVWFWHGYPDQLIMWCKENDIEAEEINTR